MAPVLDHLALLVTARVIGYQLLARKQMHAEWVRRERQALIRILDGHGIIIGLETDPARRMDQHLR